MVCITNSSQQQPAALAVQEIITDDSRDDTTGNDNQSLSSYSQSIKEKIEVTKNKYNTNHGKFTDLMNTTVTTLESCSENDYGDDDYYFYNNGMGDCDGSSTLSSSSSSSPVIIIDTNHPSNEDGYNSTNMEYTGDDDTEDDRYETYNHRRRQNNINNNNTNFNHSDDKQLSSEREQCHQRQRFKLNDSAEILNSKNRDTRIVVKPTTASAVENVPLDSNTINNTNKTKKTIEMADTKVPSSTTISKAPTTAPTTRRISSSFATPPSKTITTPSVITTKNTPTKKTTTLVAPSPTKRIHGLLNFIKTNIVEEFRFVITKEEEIQRKQESASIRIQCYVRRYLIQQRRERDTLVKAEAKKTSKRIHLLVDFIKTNIVQEREKQKQIQACTILQCYIRRYLIQRPSNLAKIIQEYIDYGNQKKACIQLQAAVRKWQTQTWYACRVQTSIVLLQSVGRGYCIRKFHRVPRPYLALARLRRQLILKEYYSHHPQQEAIGTILNLFDLNEIL